MKLLIKVLCWANILLLGAGGIGLAYSTEVVTPWAWVIVGLGAIQSTLALVYVYQHNRTDKRQAKLVEREALKAELLAEIQEAA